MVEPTAQAESPAPPAPATERRSVWPHVLIGLALSGLAAFTYRELPQYGLLGLDTLLQIDAARIESAADFRGTFTETLTDGVIKGKFYRPLQNLSIALDYRLWGLDARGYQYQSLLSYCLTVGLFYWVMRSWLGRGWIGPACAALFFALHPILMNALPTPCRRSEVLVILLLLASMWVLPIDKQRRPVLRSIVAGFLILLACGAKDIGIMGLGLVFLHQVFLTPEATALRTIVRAVLMSVPTLFAIVAYFINRTLVLDGLGGYPQAAENPLTSWQRFTQYGQETLVADLIPFLPLSLREAGWEPGPLAIGLFVALLVGAILSVLLLARRPFEERRQLAPVVLGLAWLVPPFTLLAVLHENWAWYGVLPAGGFALLIGGLVQIGVRGIAQLRPVQSVVVLPPAAALVTGLLASPLFVDYPDWREATKLLDQVWQQVDARVPNAQPGRMVQIVTQPYYKGPWPTDRPVLGAVSTVMVPGIQAYARLKYPARNPTAIGREPMPGEIKPVRLRIRFAIHPKTRSRPDGPPPWQTDKAGS